MKTKTFMGISHSEGGALVALFKKTIEVREEDLVTRISTREAMGFDVSEEKKALEALQAANKRPLEKNDG